MSVVCSTAISDHGPQDLALLRASPFVHRNGKRLRRQRCTDAFAHVVLKQPDRRTVFLVYASGKCVTLGCRSAEELMASSLWVSAILGTGSEPQVRNVVCSFRVKHTLCLPVLHLLTGGSYEPELSPALIFKPIKGEPVTAMAFSSGKVTVTGIKAFDLVSRLCGEVSRLLSCRSDADQRGCS